MKRILAQFALAAVITATLAEISEAQTEDTESHELYSELSHRPNQYLGAIFNFYGKVIQSTQNGNNYTLRISVSDTGRGIWRDTILVEYQAKSEETRIVTDDVVEFRGRFAGIASYRTVLGGIVQIPRMIACAIRAKPEEVPGLIVLRKPIECQAERQDASAPTAIDIDRLQTGVAVIGTPPSGVVSLPRSSEAAPTGGEFFVQIASGFTEKDAQSAFEFEQRRYSSVLSWGAPIIKSIGGGPEALYGAYVGPFQNSKEAIGHCEKFKSAGGSMCVVARFADDPVTRSARQR